MNNAVRCAVIPCFAVLLCTPGIAQTPPELPALADYAWGFPIQLGGDKSFYSIQLPLQVNQSVSDPQLRDAGVYNAEGRPVPRVLLQAREETEASELRRPLPMLPMFTKPSNATDAADLLLQFDGDTTTLQFRLDDSANRTVAAGLYAYIVDARELETGLDALEFEWATGNGGFIGQIAVDASDDLRNWQSVGTAAIAQLREGSAEIIQRRVALDRPAQDFLRIRWQDMPDDWRVSEIVAVYKKSATRVVRELLRLDSSAVDEADGGRVFEIGGAPLIDSVQVLLTEPNVVVTAAVYSWSGPAGRWTRLISGNFHHIGRGDNVVTSDAVTIAPLRSSRLKVVITHGQQDTPMQLQVAWRPDKLLFLSQGSGPFTLATGRADDSIEGFPQQSIFGVSSIRDLAEENGNTASAMLGPRFPLGGTSRMSAMPARNWRVIALWIGLAFGVAFVGFMAFRIIRDQKAH
jgi:hypothetical protein